MPAVLVSCDPQAFTMNIEMRYPSPSGLDLAGKTYSIVYPDNGPDSLFNSYAAEGFAAALEKDYFGGADAVEVFSMPADTSAAYFTRDSLVNLVMDTGSDVVFVFGRTVFGDRTVSEPSPISQNDTAQVVYVSAPYSIRLYVYDSLSDRDTVLVYKGASTLRQPVFVPLGASAAETENRFWPSLAAQGEKVGGVAARRFLSTWREEQYTMIYYDTPQTWTQAAQAAYEYRWHDAMTLWMSLLDTRNVSRRSCAEYNIATACYMLGDYELAAQWLDQSDRDQVISLSKGLRKRIEARQKK